MDTKKLRQKILDLAIHGKLVPQDPNDEPASVLLERIKAEKERLIKEGKIKRSKKRTKTSDTPHYENVPFEIPSSWEWTTLEEILELVSGQDFSPEKYNNNVSGIPYIIGASNIENEQLIINRWTEYPSVYSYLNDLLVVCKGAGVGKMAINNIGTVHIARQIQAIRVYTNYINIKYVKAVVKNNIESIISKANGLIPGLKRELLLSLQIPLPPFAEQQYIVKEIERWFKLIDKIEQDKLNLQTVIKQVKIKILDLAIHGKLVQQDPNDEPASELLKRINQKAEITCDNAHSEKLPQNWIWVKGKNIFLPMKSTKPKYKEFKYIDIDSIDNKRYVIRNIKTIKTLNAPSRASRYTQKNDVLFSMVRPYLRNIAKVVIDNCIASTGFYVCSCIPHILNPDYCYYLMISDYVVNGLNQFMKGDNSPSINKGHIDEWLFPLPPLLEQQRIVQKVENLFSFLDNIQKALEV